jgi:hypothetical protein
MTINISPQVEAELYNVANREGIDPAALVERIFTEYQSAHFLVMTRTAKQSACCARGVRKMPQMTMKSSTDEIKRRHS